MTNVVRLVLEVICHCHSHVNIRAKAWQGKPPKEDITVCWKCLSQIRTILNPNGGYQVHIRESYEAHWGPEHKVPNERIIQVSIERRNE